MSKKVSYMLEAEEIKSYKNGEYTIEIQKSKTDKSGIDFHLYHSNCGTKMLMFGVQEDFDDDSTILELIGKNFESYAALYQKQFEDN